MARVQLAVAAALIGTLTGCAEVKLPRMPNLGNLGDILRPITLSRPSKPDEAAKPAPTPPQANAAIIAPAPAVETPAPVVIPAPPPVAPGSLRGEDGTIRIGFLVPLTGPQAELGQAMLNAASLALFDFANPRIILVPRDAGDSLEQGRDAAQTAVSSGASLLVGPVFARAVTGAAEVAHAGKVNMIAFSSDRSVATPGAWIIGFTPDDDIRRIVEFASSKGMHQFAALVPDSAYGVRVKESLKSAMPEVQGEVTAIETFAEQPSQLSEPMRRIALAQGRPPGAASGDQSWTPRFQAVVMAEGGSLLTSLAALLPYHEVDTQRIKVLGTGLWDDARIAREPTLTNGWFAAAEPQARREFSDRYARTFGKVPPRIATLAYDAIALASVLGQTDVPDPYASEHLTQPQGFVGIDGIFRLRPDGTSERGLAILEVQRDGFRVIDPAPAAFPNTGVNSTPAM